MYKPISLTLSIIFGVVGLIFLFLPAGVIMFFNSIALHIGFHESPVHDASLYVVLSVGYMYLVMVLAFLMYRNPENASYPWLLIQGKSASSVVSFFLFVLFQPYLIFLVNGSVDGFIAAGILFLCRKIRGTQNEPAPEHL